MTDNQIALLTLAAMATLFVAAWIAGRIIYRREHRNPPRRCKMWVPLAYLQRAYTEGTLPHVQCALPAGHSPRRSHLVDPNEVAELNLHRVPF